MSNSNDLHLVEKKIDGHEVLHGRLLKVMCDDVLLPDGKKGIREYIVHPGAVVIIAELPNGNLLFERQFRYPVGQVCLELPAGKIDHGEDILETAKRELLEETGYESDDWNYLGVMHPCIGYSNERIEIFYARNLRQISPPQLDEGEFLDVIELSMEEVYEAVTSGELTDAKTMTALFVQACKQR